VPCFRFDGFNKLEFGGLLLERWKVVFRRLVWLEGMVVVMR